MFDHEHRDRKRIAIVGGGISGLSAAYYLSQHHDVTLFEASPRLGGHARTVLAGKNGAQPVDTGFIVFNYVTYPNLTRLFRELDVPVIKSEMSFGASIDDGRIEYGLNSLRSILAQKRNLLRPSYYGMISDIIRFGKQAERAADGDNKTIGELVDELRLGHWFRNNYLIPMCGAIWSTPSEDVERFPARSLVRFFKNHALLAGAGRHQWWTVKGGSIEYVRRLEAALVQRGCRIRTGQPVTGIERFPFGVTVRAARCEAEEFDKVIFACHSDQALAILKGAATPAETEALGNIRYQPNRAVLHRDTSQMPRRRASWSSWAYRSQDGMVSVTYWMNRLQNIPETDPLFVTLNPSRSIPQQDIYDEVEFSHPVFDQAALRAQDRIRAMQGENHTWFVGAYNRYGFHEDGIASAMRVVRMINQGTQQKDPKDVSYQPSAEIAVPVDLRTSA
ncbi:FAD-dependent oxidoreductase [Defluviimonas aestuarii]|uniref:NAD(P)/FAD-dependent oxidoreductase n=1 Tax=Albidovulum aestuarii TaxID=1130726 RepID=UPI002499F1B4|nr:FAD-dependent oxidoreductase [Defluviimonas aestuarii]MDI3335574.1 FAD-dependent oxidoreductase [Defluviimonas aestuarii]